MSQESPEVVIARLSEQFKGLKEAFLTMGGDVSKLADSYQKLVESNQKLALVENDVIGLKKSVDMLWTKFDAHIAAQQKTTSGILWEIIKMILVFVLGALAAHYGISLH